jgi:hypothetical protein
MTPLLMALGTVDPVLLAEGDDTTGILIAAPLAGPVVFGILYAAIYNQDRNKDKRHVFERDTDIQVGNLQTADRKNGHISRTKQRTTSGRNDADPLTRVSRIRVDTKE